MIVAPGGGHRFLSIDTEGTNVAEYLNSQGVAAFVLKYRLAREQGSTYKIDVDALADAQRAIRMLRTRASEWNLNPAKIGIMGFSAGGEVAVLASTRYDAGKADSADPIERQSSKPDYQVLIYPGIRPENYTVTKETPPTFLLAADNDRGPSTAIPALYLALKKAGVPAELHVYSSGGHGFGLQPTDTRPNVSIDPRPKDQARARSALPRQESGNQPQMADRGREWEATRGDWAHVAHIEGSWRLPCGKRYCRRYSAKKR